MSRCRPGSKGAAGTARTGGIWRERRRRTAPEPLANGEETRHFEDRRRSRIAGAVGGGSGRGGVEQRFQACWHRNPSPSYSSPKPGGCLFGANPCCPPPCCSTSYVSAATISPSFIRLFASRSRATRPVTTEPVRLSHQQLRRSVHAVASSYGSGDVVQVESNATRSPARSCRCVPVTPMRAQYLRPSRAAAESVLCPIAPGGRMERPRIRMPPTETNSASGRSESGTAGQAEFFPPPSLKPAPLPGLDCINSTPNSGAYVAGQVVSNNYVTPMRGAKLLFVSRKSEETKQTAQADNTGRFAVNLPPGGWNIFVSRGDGRLEFHSSIDVQDAQKRNVMVVSR